MTTVRRLFLLIVIGACTAFLALPSLAVDEPQTTETTTTETTTTDTTGASEEEGAGANVPPPAVTVPSTAAEEETADWTYRYLIPTLLALAVVVVIATTIQYFVRVVRNRYKVVE